MPAVDEDRQQGAEHDGHDSRSDKIEEQRGERTPGVQGGGCVYICVAGCGGGVLGHSIVERIRLAFGLAAKIAAVVPESVFWVARAKCGGLGFARNEICLGFRSFD